MALVSHWSVCVYPPFPDQHVPVVYPSADGILGVPREFACDTITVPICGEPPHYHLGIQKVQGTSYHILDIQHLDIPVDPRPGNPAL